MTSKKSYADPSLRPNKRWISAHDSTGKSIYAESPEQIYHKSTIGGMARSFALESVPAIMKNDIDIKNYQGTDSKASFTKSDIVIPGGGIHLLVMDLKPEAESPLHRTQSIDFSICVMGEIVCEQDSGEKVTLLPGDHVIQRGTMHKWYNASKTESARAVCVTIPAEAFEIPGVGMLKDEWIPLKPKM